MLSGVERTRRIDREGFVWHAEAPEHSTSHAGLPKYSPFPSAGRSIAGGERRMDQRSDRRTETTGENWHVAVCASISLRRIGAWFAPGSGATFRSLARTFVRKVPRRQSVCSRPASLRQRRPVVDREAAAAGPLFMWHASNHRALVGVRRSLMPLFAAEYPTPPPLYSSAADSRTNSYGRVLAAATASDPVQMPEVSVSARPAAKGEFARVGPKLSLEDIRVRLREGGIGEGIGYDSTSNWFRGRAGGSLKLVRTPNFLVSVTGGAQLSPEDAAMGKASVEYSAGVYARYSTPRLPNTDLYVSYGFDAASRSDVKRGDLDPGVKVGWRYYLSNALPGKWKGLDFSTPVRWMPANFRIGLTGLSTVVEASTSGSDLSSEGGLTFGAQTIVFSNDHGQVYVGYEFHAGQVREKDRVTLKARFYGPFVDRAQADAKRYWKQVQGWFGY